MPTENSQNCGQIKTSEVYNQNTSYSGKCWHTEVKRDELIREKAERSTVNNRPETGGYQGGNNQRVGFVGNRKNRSGVSGEVRSGIGRNVLLSERGKSADTESVIENGNGSIINNDNIGDGAESNDRSRKNAENVGEHFEIQAESKRGTFRKEVLMNWVEHPQNYDLSKEALEELRKELSKML